MTEANGSTPTTTMTVSPQSDAVNKLDLSAGKQNLTPKTPVENQDANYEGGAELEPDSQDKEKSGKATGKQKQLSYAEVVEGVATSQVNLSFIPADVVNGQLVATLTVDDVIEGCGEWDKALLCCVLGANPPVDVIKGFVNRIWREYRIEDVSFLKEGQYIVHFQMEEDRDEVAKRSYYFFDNKPMYVRKWSPDCKVNVNELKDVPIWIQFPNLNMRYWSLSGLSKLGSIIGKPIKRDKATAMRAKWGYARIQLEVQVQQEFPDLLSFINEEGRVITQEVVYEWKPCVCAKCNRMGHITEMCRKSNGEGQDKKTKKVWRPKQQSKENEANEKEEKTPPKEVEIVNMTKENSSKGDIEEEDDQNDFKLVSKKKSARRITIDELMQKREDPPYTVHYPFLS
ncbi:hypothetical protein DM860_012320 [Cuscuta australis]|uniref:DUF4283 domain-containing protein n=1 Tax=Cuscuta australis TaxID=267555 RepID=A0A328DPV7_9ASTE|nr:hypothetical protein DM860_012320 [Cuscuta australis]